MGMTEAATTTRMTEMTQKPEVTGMLSTLRAIPVAPRLAWAPGLGLTSARSRRRRRRPSARRSRHRRSGSRPAALCHRPGPSSGPCAADWALSSTAAGRRAVVRTIKVVPAPQSRLRAGAHELPSVLRVNTSLRTLRDPGQRGGDCRPELPVRPQPDEPAMPACPVALPQTPGHTWPAQRWRTCPAHGPHQETGVLQPLVHPARRHGVIHQPERCANRWRAPV